MQYGTVLKYLCLSPYNLSMRSVKLNFPLFLFALPFFVSINACEQNSQAKNKPVSADTLDERGKNPYVTLDQSSMDMSYYPVNYPVLKMNKQDSVPPVARVIYSRPHKKNRIIFSNDASSLCQYGKAWRLGANEATEIEFFRNVTIAGRNLSKGSYIVYCIPEPDKWIIVFNDNLHTWGLHMDSTKDVLRTEIPVKKQSPMIEDFTIIFNDAEYGADMLMAWDNVFTTLPITFSK